jgi:hypothetical protein
MRSFALLRMTVKLSGKGPGLKDEELYESDRSDMSERPGRIMV